MFGDILKLYKKLHLSKDTNAPRYNPTDRADVLDYVLKLSETGAELSLMQKGATESWLPTVTIVPASNEIELCPFPFKVSDDVKETRLAALEFFEEKSIKLSTSMIELVWASS